MIITIDGPGASGKSVVAQRLAERLQAGYRCLNTGAMYRAVGVVAARRCGAELADDDCIGRVAQALLIDFDWNAAPPTLLIDGRAADAEIHSERAASYASRVARVPMVRSALVAQQCRIGRQMPMLVSEGRDQGSVVFPEAPFKFFLTADVSVRARRRYEQLVRKGRPADPETVLEDLIARDHQDTSSEVGRLIVPKDAIVVDTTDINGIDEVTDRMYQLVRSRAGSEVDANAAEVSRP